MKNRNVRLWRTRWNWTARLILCSMVAASEVGAGAHPAHTSPHAHSRKHASQTTTEFVYADDLASYRIRRDGTLELPDDQTLNSEQVGDTQLHAERLVASPDHRSFLICGTIGAANPKFFGSTINIPECIPYAVKPNGRLTVQNKLPLVLGGPQCYPASAAFTPYGKQFFVLVNDDSGPMGKSVLSQYRIKRDGSATHTAAPVCIARAKGRDSRIQDPFIVLDPAGKNAYISDSQNRCIRRYRLTPAGTLKPVASETLRLPFAPRQIFIPPAGGYAYVPDVQMRHIAVYRIASQGHLAWARTQTLRGVNPLALTFSPDGKFLYYSAILGPTGGIVRYRLGPGGVLQPLPLIKTDRIPYFMAIDPAGKFSYLLTNEGAGNCDLRQCRITAQGAFIPLKPKTVSVSQDAFSLVVIRSR